MHKNFYRFKATENFEMGCQLGEAFSSEADQELNYLASTRDWGSTVDFSLKLLDKVPARFINYIQEIKGYANGAKIEFEDFWAMCLAYDGLGEPYDAHCTSIVSNNGRLIGHNEDEENPGLEQEVCIVEKDISGLKTFEVFYYNSLGGSSIGMNSHGFVQTINSLLDIGSNPFGLPEEFVVRTFLDSKDPKADYEFFNSLVRLSGYNHNLIFPNGEIWNIEFDPSGGSLQRVESPYVHTNHTVQHKSPLSGDIHGTFTRFEQAKKKLQDKMSPEEMQQLLMDKSHGEEKSICNRRTIASSVFDVENGIAYVWLQREEEKGWVEYDLGEFLRRN